MKLLMGFIILLVALVAFTGCTQPASTTTPVTTEATAVPTSVPATVETTIPVNTTTIPVNMTTIVANVTAPAANATEPVATTTVPAIAATSIPAEGVTKISITSAGFTPKTDIVLPGTGVSFVNNDNVSHTVVSTGNSTGMFNSGTLIPGAAFQYTFNTNAGTVTYALADNSTATGTIIVKIPSSIGHSSVS